MTVFYYIISIIETFLTTVARYKFSKLYGWRYMGYIYTVNTHRTSINTTMYTHWRSAPCSMIYNHLLECREDAVLSEQFPFTFLYLLGGGGRGESDHMTQIIMNISVKRVSITNLITDRTIYRFYRGCKRVITPYVIIEYCYFKCRLVTCYRQPKWILVTWYKDKGPIECICHFSLNPKSRMTILQRYP